jgi:aminopeptidase N
VVCRQYDEPIHLFDAHLYEKGGRVLHMLRHELGDSAFWRAIGQYARKHAHGSVETRDLARAIEDATGRNVDELLDRWIARPGHPELEGRWDWDEDRKLGTLRIAQKQPITPEAPPFKFSTAVRFEVDGRQHDEHVTVSEATHAFELRMPARPTQVIFDPGDVVLKTIRLEKHAVLWRRQLAAARLAIDRVAAARALGHLPDPAGIAALAAALGGDDFWGVRAAAARALGQTRRDDARDALIGAANDKHPRVRRAVAAALGRVPRRLGGRPNAGGPPAPRRRQLFRRGRDALALGRTRTSDAMALLPSFLDRASYQDVIRSRAVEGSGPVRRRAAPSRSSATPGGPAHRGSRVGRSSRRWRAGARHRHRARGARVHRDALSDRDFRVRGEASVALHGWRRSRRFPRCERAGRRAGRPRAAPHGGGDPRPRGGHAPQRGDPPPARRGRTPRARNRQAARALDRLQARSRGPRRRPRARRAQEQAPRARSRAAPAARAPSAAEPTPSPACGRGSGEGSRYARSRRARGEGLRVSTRRRLSAGDLAVRAQSRRAGSR